MDASAAPPAPTPVASQVRRDFVALANARIRYADYEPADSEAPPVVMIHGASASHLDLELALLPEAARGRRVLLFDRPGHGRSTRPRGAHDPFIQAQILRDAASALGAERPILLAHSLGGAIALAWALEFGEEISGLVLLAPVSHPWPGGVDWHHHAAVAPVIGPLFRRTIAPVAGPRIARRYLKPPLPANYFERAELRNLFRPQTFKANSEDIYNLKKHVTRMSRRYHEISAPMRIIAGDRDVTVCPMIHSHHLAREAANAKLTLLPGVGHFLQHDRPKKALAALDEVAALAGARLEAR
ncbi:MAG: alpha/beta hydrolase [Parvularculaceae bacterium]